MNEFGLDTQAFWKTLEETTGEIIPTYLKKLISAAGYARYNALKVVDDSLIASLEMFGREQMPIFFEASSESLHIYYKHPEQFKIVPGHIDLLKDAATKLSSNSKAFMKLYRKYSHCFENTSETKGFANSSQGAQPLATIQSSEKNTIDNPEKCSKDANDIKNKIMRWSTSKHKQLKHDPEVLITGPRQAKVKCSICSRFVRLSTRNNKNGSWGWIISNFTQHVTEHDRPRPKTTINNFFNKEIEEANGFNKVQSTAADIANEEQESSVAENSVNVDDIIVFDPQTDEEADTSCEPLLKIEPAQ